MAKIDPAIWIFLLVGIFFLGLLFYFLSSSSSSSSSTSSSISENETNVTLAPTPQSSLQYILNYLFNNPVDRQGRPLGPAQRFLLNPTKWRSWQIIPTDQGVQYRLPVGALGNSSEYRLIWEGSWVLVNTESNWKVIP